MKIMDKSANGMQIKPSKIVALVATILLVVATIGAIITDSILPKTQRLYSEDAGRITAAASTSTDEWFYATSMGAIYRLNGDDKIVETFDLSKVLSEKGEDCGSIRSLYSEATAKYIYAFTSSMNLVQLKDENGKLTLIDYAKLKGNILSITEYGDEVYVIRQQDSYNAIEKFDVNNLSNGALSTGYLYDGYVGSGRLMNLSYIKNIAIYSFEVVEEVEGKYLYILHSGGLLRISADFEMNQWKDTITALVAEKYEKLYASAKESVENEADIDTKALEKQAREEAYAELGVAEFIESQGKLKIKDEYFDLSLYGSYTSNEVIYGGCAFVREDNKYYLLASDGKLYSYNLSDAKDLSMSESLVATEVSKIKLAGMPKSVGNSLFYNKETKVAYVVYEASDKLTCIDLDKEEVVFTTVADFKIGSVIQSASGDKIHYTYVNVNEAESGVYILRSLTIGGQQQEPVLKAIRTILIIIAILAAIVALFAYLCWFKRGFSDKFVYTMRAIAKHWAIYAILLSCMSLVAVFCYYPAIGAIRLSFFDYTKETPAELWNNFSNYKYIFTSSSALEEFTNMFFFLFWDLFTSLLPPLIFAFFLTIMRNKNYSGLMRTLLFIPGVIPGVATMLIWKTGIYGEFGVLNAVIKMVEGQPVKFLAQTNIAKWSLVLMGFPYVGSYLIFYGAMMNVPDSYYEAAELDGITVMKRFVFIDVPLIFAQIKYVMIMTFISSVQNFGRVYMVTRGSWGTKTPIFTMYQSVLDGNYGLASAYATIIFVFLFVATVVNFRMQRRDNEV